MHFTTVVAVDLFSDCDEWPLEAPLFCVRCSASAVLRPLFCVRCSASAVLRPLFCVMLFSVMLFSVMLLSVSPCLG